MLERIPQRYWLPLTLAAWTALVLLTGQIRSDNFGLDEGAARALLLTWTLAEQITNPIALMGAPDLRALIYLPMGIYWPGSLLALKVYTLILAFIGIWALMRWSQSHKESESALIATGLLLVSPFLFKNINAAATGPYLLLAFGLSWWVDQAYRASTRPLGAWYFVQMLIAAVAISLHPAGLALPIALLWHWRHNPTDQRRQKLIYAGVAAVFIIMLSTQLGWVNLNWFKNPMQALNYATLHLSMDEPLTAGYFLGFILLGVFALVAWSDRDFIKRDFLTTQLFSASVLGLLAADIGWTLILWSYLLYRGLPQLIRLHARIPANNFLGQRGLVMVLIFILATLFMRADRLESTALSEGITNVEDELIQSLAEKYKDKETLQLRIASQWPARTMLITRRDTFRLPPEVSDGTKLAQITQGLTHIVFNHNDPLNAHLSRNIAELGNKMKTLAIQPGGVIIEVSEPVDKGTTSSPQ